MSSLHHHQQTASSAANMTSCGGIQKTTLSPAIVDKTMHSQMDLSTHHYSLGFASLAASVFPTATTKSPNFNYGSGQFKAYTNEPTNAAACAYLSTNYCSPNYNNFSALRYKSHGYPSI